MLEQNPAPTARGSATISNMYPTAAPTNTALNTFINAVEQQIINPLIILVTIIALVIFFWGIVQYIQNAANDEKRKQGQQAMIWGIVGLVIIFGAIAIVNIIKNISGFFSSLT